MQFFRDNGGQGLKSPNKMFEGVPVYGSLFGNLKNGAAMTLPGIGIFVNPNDLNDIHLLRHEFGHILQARKYGLEFFYTVIGPASLASAAARTGNHNLFWTEVQANTLSWQYFGAPSDWIMDPYVIDLKWIHHGDPLLSDPFPYPFK